MNQKKIDRTNHPPTLADLICSSPWDGLMKEILKFRDKRDWAQFHILNNYIGQKVRWYRYYRVD
jgi:hypothetical protein